MRTWGAGRTGRTAHRVAPKAVAAVTELEPLSLPDHRRVLHGRVTPRHDTAEEGLGPTGREVVEHSADFRGLPACSPTSEANDTELRRILQRGPSVRAGDEQDRVRGEASAAKVAPARKEEQGTCLRRRDDGLVGRWRSVGGGNVTRAACPEGDRRRESGCPQNGTGCLDLQGRDVSGFDGWVRREHREEHDPTPPAMGAAFCTASRKFLGPPARDNAQGSRPPPLAWKPRIPCRCMGVRMRRSLRFLVVFALVLTAPLLVIVMVFNLAGPAVTVW